MNASWLDEAGATPTGPIDPITLADNGIVHRELPTDPGQFQGPLDELRAERGYIEQDEVELSKATPNLAEICAKFVDEHFHDDDEVRFVLDGAGIFDIRSNDDRWMRVTVTSGNLIVVPARRYHRFSLTDDRSIRCVRLFRDTSGWVPHYRSES